MQGELFRTAIQSGFNDLPSFNFRCFYAFNVMVRGILISNVKKYNYFNAILKAVNHPILLYRRNLVKLLSGMCSNASNYFIY